MIRSDGGGTRDASNARIIARQPLEHPVEVLI
jgi:hypothetical protein